MLTGIAERAYHEKTGKDKTKPLHRSYFQRTGARAAIEYYYGKQKQCKWDKDRRQDGGRPGGWYEKEYVPIHNWAGPIDEDFEPYIVEDIPDCEDG